MQEQDKRCLDLLALRARFGFAISPDCFTNLRRSANCGLTHVFKDKYDRPIGYIAWANINKESFLEMQKSGKLPLNTYEWNEGQLTLLLDVTFKKGQRNLRRLITDYFAKRRVLIFLKNKRISMYARSEGRFHAVPRVSQFEPLANN